MTTFFKWLLKYNTILLSSCGKKKKWWKISIIMNCINLVNKLTGYHILASISCFSTGNNTSVWITLNGICISYIHGSKNYQKCIANHFRDFILKLKHQLAVFEEGLIYIYSSSYVQTNILFFVKKFAQLVLKDLKKLQWASKCDCKLRHSKLLYHR